MKTSVAAKNFCANVKRLREENFFDHDVMAKLCGISVSSLRMIEDGYLTVDLALTVMERLHDTLLVNPSALISDNVDDFYDGY